MGRTALLLGATGLVGREVVSCLLEEPEYDKVNILARRPLDVVHPKLNVAISDLDHMEDHEALFRVDDIYCCLGTTIKKAGTREAFRKVDYEYPLRAARLGKKNGASGYILVSAMGASKESRFFYSRVKGELEEALKKTKYEKFVTLRPSLLLGKREHDFRMGEKLAEYASIPMRFLFRGKLSKFKPVHADSVAAMMVTMALVPKKGVMVLESIGESRFASIPER